MSDAVRLALTYMNFQNFRTFYFGAFNFRKKTFRTKLLSISDNFGQNFEHFQTGE